MATSNLGEIRKVTPSDIQSIAEFNYLQVGIAGTVSVQFKNGDVKLLTQELINRMALVPVGVMDRVLATGTTATDIYVW